MIPCFADRYSKEESFHNIMPTTVVMNGISIVDPNKIDQIDSSIGLNANEINELGNTVADLTASVDVLSSSLDEVSDQQAQDASALSRQLTGTESALSTQSASETNQILSALSTVIENQNIQGQIDEIKETKVNASSVATINGQSILNGGNIVISGGESVDLTGYATDASVAEAISEAVAGLEPVDLSDYSTTAEIRAQLDPIESSVTNLSSSVTKINSDIAENYYNKSSAQVMVSDMLNATKSEFQADPDGDILGISANPSMVSSPLYVQILKASNNEVLYSGLFQDITGAEVYTRAERDYDKETGDVLPEEYIVSYGNDPNALNPNDGAIIIRVGKYVDVPNPYLKNDDIDAKDASVLAAARAEIDTLRTQVAGIAQFRTEIVNQLPQVGEYGVIYMVPKALEEQTEDDLYNEYLWNGSGFDFIGAPSIDLSGYAKTEDLSGFQTASDVSTAISTAMSSALKMWKGTQAQYDAIQVKDPDTLYIVSD